MNRKGGYGEKEFEDSGDAFFIREILLPFDINRF